MLYAGNKLTGNGLLPEQMAAENRSQVYTSPDESKNDLLQFQLSGHLGCVRYLQHYRTSLQT